MLTDLGDFLPLPPPCGWSTGFMATPRTVGRIPFKRLYPAFNRFRLFFNTLPTIPTVAIQFNENSFILPFENITTALAPLFDIIIAHVPALLQYCPPSKGLDSKLCIFKRSGTFFNTV